MNEEILLKKYLFNFLRSPDYVTDVNFYLPKFPTNDTAFAETQRVLSWEHEQYRLKIIDFAKQFHPQTATWGLNVWEEELGLKTDLSEDLELRRAKVMAKLLGASPMTVANTNKLVNLFTDDGKAYVDELPEDGTIKIIIPSLYANVDEMRRSLDEMLPAHLAYNFQHVIEIDVKDDDGESSDSFADVNDEGGESFSVNVNFPIAEDIPYHKKEILTQTPKFDGSVQVKPPKMFDKKFIYDGTIKYNGENTEAAQVGKSYRWWFVPTGESTFNKEFRCDGAIKFDGLKPQTIEYDDGMDDLSVIEIEKILEDEVAEEIQFDGKAKFDGNTKRKIPDDDGGKIEITKFKRFNGAIQYNGGDLNYFNGSIKADGKFIFDSGGNRAQIEKISDELSGNFSNVKPKKEFPISEFYPEIYEYVPKIFEKQSAEISFGTFDENIETPTDEKIPLTIQKVIRYNGAKNYNGGDINYFNGTIKADGKFNFEGGGSRAKIEVIAIDLDGSLSFKQTQKDKPPFIYVENSDFVSQTQDEIKFSVENDFEEIINLKDCDGDLKISRRRKFDGYLNYRGDFEYPANGSRRFGGGLNYNGVYRQEADGFSKFDGAERYGGRKNYSVYEVVTDLNGNFKVIKIIDFEKIPIATYEKLGYVIAGENLDIDVEGKISLPTRIKNQNMAEMQGGTLRNIFESWRNENAF